MMLCRFSYGKCKKKWTGQSCCCSKMKLKISHDSYMNVFIKLSFYPTPANPSYKCPNTDCLAALNGVQIKKQAYSLMYTCRYSSEYLIPDSAMLGFKFQ